MGEESQERTVKTKVETLLEDVDKNKDKKIDASEKKDFSEEVVRQLEDIRAIIEGSDVLKREALTRAIIEVTGKYENITPDDVYQWINKRPMVSRISLGAKGGTLDLQPDGVGIVAVRGLQRVSPRTTLEAIDYDRAFNAMHNIAAGKKVDFKSLSNEQKILLVLQFGREGGRGYDYDRKTDIFSGKSVSIREFFDKVRSRHELAVLIEDEAYRMVSGVRGRPLFSDTKVVSSLLKRISKTYGIDEAKLKTMWDEAQKQVAQEQVTFYQGVRKFEDAIVAKYFQIGVCRDVAVFQAKLASDMGLADTFVTSVSWGGRAHSLGGFRNEKGNIVFFNWGELIETDTPNMRLALAFLEKNMESIALQYIGAKGSESGENLVPLKSAASETMEEIARGTPKNPGQILSEAMDKGGFERREGMNFSVEREKTGIDLNLHTLGGATLISTRYFNPRRPDNSIDEAHSFRAAQEYGGEHLAGGVGTAVAHVELKANLGAQKVDIYKLLIDLYAKAHKTVKITPELEYQISAMVDAIVDVGLNDFTFSSAELEIATGQRLSYITPDLMLYVGMQTVHQAVPQNIQISAVNPTVYTMTNDVLAANFGANVQLGAFMGHRVAFSTQAQAGTVSSGLGTEYKGRAKLEAQGSEGTSYIAGGGTYTASHDFRVGEASHAELEVGHVRPMSNGRVLEIKGFVFNDVSLEKFKDPRLDNLGAGFNLTYSF